MTPFATDIIESQLEDATCRPILEAEVAMLRNEASTRPPDWMFEDLRDADTDEGRAIAIEVLLRAALGVRANKGNPLQEEK